MDVVLLRWPLERARRDELAADGRARLLLVEGDVPPPVVESALEDWIRVPADEVDVRARTDALARRGSLEAKVRPVLDPDGVLRFAGEWVPLPPVEARLTSALVSRFGAVVSREVLASAGWPD